ncbi:MAG: TRAP transporter permease [Firmicutes bacterium]|nr:TRAP transporter permease [Bacillota bacterium]
MGQQPVSEPQREYSIERRTLSGAVATAVTVIAVAASLFHFYNGGLGAMSTMDVRVIHLVLMLVPAFIVYPSSIRSRERVGLLDIVLIATSIAGSLFVLSSWRAQLARVADPTTLQIVLGCLMIAAVLEAARRTTGPALTVTAIVFLVYALYGPYFPGLLGHKGYSITRLVSFLVMTGEGIYGIPLSVSSTYVVLFVLFGSLMNRFGGGRLFIDVAYSITGRFRGGPAKTAIVSSALMGTISGSPIANVMTTGTFTIPLMVQMGYHPHVAGAVEAVASTGGMLMPPVMGAAAFIIAQYLGVSYTHVAWAALIPAVLYFACVFFIVDMEAVKCGMRGLAREELPNLTQVLAGRMALFLPVVTLVVFILREMSPMRAVFLSICLMVLVSFLGRSTRPSLKTLIQALEDGAVNSIPVAASCACAGLVVGVISITGIGVKFSSSLIQLAHGSVFLALIYTAVASIILGMGMPATAVYIIQAALNVPALIQLGVSPLSAHMFVFYYSAIGCITPPVALTAYAAAGISGAHPGRTGWSAFLFGAVAYVVPFVFTYSPQLLMQGSVVSVVFAFATALAGVYMFACAIEGLFLVKRNALERILLFAAGLALVIPGGSTDLIAAVLIGGVLVFGVRRQRRGSEPRAA